MFFCESCRKKNKWPGLYFVSFGNCEICKKPSDCYDIKSSELPIPGKHIEED